MTALALTISDISIRQDDQGRYCLNDLHKAAGGEDKHRPTYWLKIQQTLDLQKELEIDGIPSIVTKQGLGTFTAKELVYAYAMWISAKFHIAVIRAYDALVTGQSQPALKSLPLKKTKVAVEGGLSLETQDELKNMINDLAATLPKDKQTSAIIGMWSALSSHFDAKALKEAIGDKKLAAYKFIPEASRLECLSLLARLPFNDLVTLSHTEMTALIESKVQERVKSLPAPAPLEGEVLLNTLPTDTITISLNKGFRLMSLVFNGKPDSPQSYYVKVDEDYLEIRSLDAEVMIKNLKDKGFVVFSKDDVSIRKLVNEYIPYQHLPLLIEAAAQRQQAIERGRKTRLDA